jgi:hypothetical protein
MNDENEIVSGCESFLHTLRLSIEVYLNLRVSEILKEFFSRKKHGISTPYISRLDSCMCEGILSINSHKIDFLSRRNTCFFSYTIDF